MSHVRQQIREAVGTALTGLTTTGTNVFTNRVYNLPDSKLPALVIYVKDETTGTVTSSSIQRMVTLVIEGYAKAASDLDDTLDTIAAEVEAAIWQNTSVLSLGKFTDFKGTEIDFAGGETEKPVGVIRLSYEIMYFTTGDDPETAL